MRFLLSCLVVGLLAGCATAPPIPVGTKVTDQLVIYKKQIPLPPGEWTVRGAATGQTAGVSSGMAGANFVRLVLLNPKGNPFLIHVYANSGQGRGYGWVTYNYCSRDDMLLRETAVNFEGREQECWWNNHRRMTRGSRSLPEVLQGYDYAYQNNLAIPLNALSVGCSAAAGQDGLLWMAQLNTVIGVNRETLQIEKTCATSSYGVAIDFSDRVWTVAQNGDVNRLNPDTCGVVTYQLGGQAYTYSDMTGYAMFHAG